MRTEFARAAGYAQEVRGRPLMRIVPAADGAAAGWAGLMAGRAEVVPDVRTRIGLQILRFMRWRLVARTAGSPRHLPEAKERR